MKPYFPARAIVTAGMPYGNKGLHFGHIGGVFIPADCYARFLRDRIGYDKVLFISGTDCYGSSIDEGYRKLKESGFSGSVRDYVQNNHDEQAATLAAYDISLNIYEGSALGKSQQTHQLVTDEFITKLFENGWLQLDATAQFYDTEARSFLNGRQVEGACPVQGCKSEHAYADECDLGHQYMPEELLFPTSTISGQSPELREVTNWYFDLPAFTDLLKEQVAVLKADDITRPVVADTIAEFLVSPSIYVKQEYLELYEQLKAQLPSHEFHPQEKGKASFELEFADLASRDEARSLLNALGIRLRTGKALVPFRITGNVEWGVASPALADTAGLTVWCWPESLWAPISFSRTWLENQGEGIETLFPDPEAKVSGSWEDFWCSADARVYQFIGQDNIYFYGIAQPAMWSALSQIPGNAPCAYPADGLFQQTQLVANYHLLFLDKKASSSAAIKPPMANDLLDYYTVEQLRAHFLALGLSKKPVSFRPKVLNPAADAKAPDPVLKEGVLLTNVFNRLARSCFYEAQKNFAGELPLAEIPAQLLAEAQQACSDYEWAMYKTELHSAFEIASEFIRSANKYWSDAIRDAGDTLDKRRQVLAASFYLLRVATILMHPIVPRGCELICEYFNLDVTAREFFSWEHIDAGFEAFVSPTAKLNGSHRLKELPARFDFFAKHPSQA